MSQEIEDHQLPSRPENALSAADGPVRVDRMMQGLAENDQINTFRLDWRIFQVTQAELEVFQSVALGFAGPERHHFFRIIDCDDLSGTLGEQFANQPLAGTEVGNDNRRQDPEQQLPKRLPGSSGTITAVEAPGDLIEVNLGLFASAHENAFEIDLVPGMLGQFSGPLHSELDQLANRLSHVRVEFVERPLAFTPRLQEARFLKQSQMRRYARLAKAGDFLKFMDGEFFLLEKGNDAEPGGIRQSAQCFDGVGHN